MRNHSVGRTVKWDASQCPTAGLIVLTGFRDADCPDLPPLEILGDTRPQLSHARLS